jgi:4-hydroxyphenylpyruvate dioxygenase-like putative hemolysin
MSASIKALTIGIVCLLLGVASTSFLHGQADTLNGTATHLGFAVHDIDKSAKEFSELFGLTVPPVQSVRDVPLGPSYHGKTMNVKYTSFTAFGMRIELVQNFDGDGIYSEFVAKHGEGLHHVGLTVADVPHARDMLLARGAILAASVRPDASLTVDLASMVPFSLELGKAAAR